MKGTLRRGLAFVLLSSAPISGATSFPTTPLASGADLRQQEAIPRPEYRVDVTAPQHDAFGFREGEQRRYARGPERIFKAGEFEIWTLRLDEVTRAASGMPLYTFTYGREVSLISPNDPGQMDSFRATMSMTLNHYGFPVEIRYGGNALEESTTDFVNKRGRLRWLGSAYLFRAPEGADEHSFNFVLPEHDALNRRIPAGVFVSETENPALITIPTAIFQALGVKEMEYLSLRPNRIGRQQARRGRRPGDIGRRTDVVRGKLAFKEMEEIELGGRRYEALKLASSDSDQDLYIRPDGALLLMRADFRNWRGHIRLLHPSEY
jgi:hypothetical protein